MAMDCCASSSSRRSISSSSCCHGHQLAALGLLLALLGLDLVVDGGEAGERVVDGAPLLDLLADGLHLGGHGDEVVIAARRRGRRHRRHPGGPSRPGSGDGASATARRRGGTPRRRGTARRPAQAAGTAESRRGTGLAGHPTRTVPPWRGRPAGARPLPAVRRPRAGNHAVRNPHRGTARHQPAAARAPRAGSHGGQRLRLPGAGLHPVRRSVRMPRLPGGHRCDHRSRVGRSLRLPDGDLRQVRRSGRLLRLRGGHRCGPGPLEGSRVGRRRVRRSAPTLRPRDGCRCGQGVRRRGVGRHRQGRRSARLLRPRGDGRCGRGLRRGSRAGHRRRGVGRLRHRQGRRNGRLLRPRGDAGRCGRVDRSLRLPGGDLHLVRRSVWMPRRPDGHRCGRGLRVAGEPRVARRCPGGGRVVGACVARAAEMGGWLACAAVAAEGFRREAVRGVADEAWVDFGVAGGEVCGWFACAAVAAGGFGSEAVWGVACQTWVVSRVAGCAEVCGCLAYPTGTVAARGFGWEAVWGVAAQARVIPRVAGCAEVGGRFACAAAAERSVGPSPVWRGSSPGAPEWADASPTRWAPLRWGASVSGTKPG